jgi:hypothetical protein
VANTFGYDAGTAAATVDVPAAARLTRVAVVAGASAATIVIAGGDTITVPAGMAFGEEIMGDVPRGADVVIGGTVATYFVAWMT